MAFRSVARSLATSTDDEQMQTPSCSYPRPRITFTPMSSLFGGAAASSSATATQGDLTKDVEVQNPPEDSISDLAFSPASDHLAVASWDKKVRIYEISEQGNSQGKALFEHEGPVLSCCWSKVGTNTRSLPAQER